MRYPQILLSITFLVVQSTTQAEEPPKPRLPESALRALETRVGNLEKRVDALEGKCNCAVTGDCTCTPENCECKNCPEHTKYPQLGKSDSPRVLFFTADWCQPCQAAKKRLGDLVDRMEIVDCSKPTPRSVELCVKYGVELMPTALVVENGKEKSRCVGDHVGKSIIAGWLDGKTSARERAGAGVKDEPRRRSAPSAPVYYRPTYYQPRTYFRPTYGGCATCR